MKERSVERRMSEPTRRDFLKGATSIAAGLAAVGSSNGENVLLATNQRNQNTEERTIDPDTLQQGHDVLKIKSGLFLGTQYYRPPNPRPGDWDRDLLRIKETGLQVVRVWLYWAKVNPHPRVWTWVDYDTVFDLAEKNGVRVLLQFMPEAAPYWFAAKHPQVRYIDKDGQPIELHSIPALAIGGYPGVSIDHPIAKTAVEEFVRRTVEHYRRHRALYGYDAWNEIWLPEDYSNETEARFQNWLGQEYSPIGALNRKYGRSYTSFTDIRIPKAGVYGDMFDYWEFLHWVKQDRLRWLAQTIRSADPHHMVVSHTGYPFNWDSDAWGLAREVDRWGTSCYIGNDHPSLEPEDIHDIALVFNATRDSAQGRPWWVAEMTGGSFWEGLAHGRTSEAEIRLKMVLGISLGAEGLMFWQWRPEIYGQESPNFGLAGLDGALNSRTETVRDVSRMLANYKDIFDNLEWAQPQVGLMWAPRGALYEHEMPSEKHVGWWNLKGFYGALIDGGFSVEILNDRVLAESGIPNGLKVIFAPFQLFDRAGLSAHLKEWVKSGGTLIGGPRYALYDPDTYANESVPPAEISEVFGTKMVDTFYSPNPIIQIESRSIVDGLPPTVKGHLFMETYQVNDADVLGKWNDRPVLTIKKFGRGRGIMLGSFLGVGYSWQQAPQLAKLSAAICKSSGVSPEGRASDGIIIRIARSGNDRVVFLINPLEISKSVSVRLSEALSGPVIDLFHGREVGHALPGKPIQLTMEAKEAKVLLCKAQ